MVRSLGGRGRGGVALTAATATGREPWRTGAVAGSGASGDVDPARGAGAGALAESEGAATTTLVTAGPACSCGRFRRNRSPISTVSVPEASAVSAMTRASHLFAGFFMRTPADALSRPS